MARNFKSLNLIFKVIQIEQDCTCKSIFRDGINKTTVPKNVFLEVVALPQPSCHLNQFTGA
jgi:hypothetical protein